MEAIEDCEEWRDILGFEGKYQVSNKGRVRSLPHPVRLVAHGKETTRVSPGKVLRPAASFSGHLSVVLGRGNTRAVHRLVVETFLGPCPPGHETLHLNHTPSDNRIENLKYGTRSENMRMDYSVGARKVHQNFIGARWRV